MTRLALFCPVLVAACGVSSLPEEPAAALSDGKADSSTWCHANLDSTDGTAMVMDYQVQAQHDQHHEADVATPLWINVKNPAFDDTQSARAVLVSFTYTQQCGSYCRQYAQVAGTYQIDLEYRDGRFTGLAPDQNLTYYETGDDISAEYFWELAVVVDGHWYKDPSTGNNLRTYPGDSPGYCERGHVL